MAGDTTKNQVTRILRAASEGDSGVAAELLPLVYEELRRIAGGAMAKEPPGQTLQPTALVHEAYLRLVGDPDLVWENRRHFFAAAARAMRRILIDRARRKRTVKHGGELERVNLDDAEAQPAKEQPEELLALDEALEQLEHFDSRKAQVVILRYFGGLSVEETANSLGISPTTVKQEWKFARAWLYSEMRRRNEFPT